MKPLFIPSVTVAAIEEIRDLGDRPSVVLQLFTWERDRLLTLAKGMGGAAVTVLTGLIAAAATGQPSSRNIIFFASGFFFELLVWGGWLLVKLHLFAEQYPAALRRVRG